MAEEGGGEWAISAEYNMKCFSSLLEMDLILFVAGVEVACDLVGCDGLIVGQLLLQLRVLGGLCLLIHSSILAAIRINVLIFIHLLCFPRLHFFVLRFVLYVEVALRVVD